jgi:hypothetical protein
MNLSTAIRVGAKMRAACESGWTDIGPDGQARTCALVAAAEGAGLFTINGSVIQRGPNWRPPVEGFEDARGYEVPQQAGLSSGLPDEWRLVTNAEEVPPCPCGKYGITGSGMHLIWHLHDVHQWSREAVAEWIETVEKKIAASMAHDEARRLRLIQEQEQE